MKSIRRLREFAPIALLAAGLSLAPAVRAQVGFTGTYTQNFDSMGTAGTAAPTGWSVYSMSGSNDTFSYYQDPTSGSPTAGAAPTMTLPAGSTLTVESTLTAVAAANNTTSKGLGGYNFATTASDTNRALGTSPSGNAATILEAAFTNSTGSSITALSLSYDIRRFTTTTNNNTTFTQAADPTYNVEENPGYWLYYSLNGGTTWTNVSSLNPKLSGTSGVVVQNSVGVTNVVDPTLSLGSAWAAGSTLTLAWIDDNAQGPSPDQLLGLDNVSLSSIPEPSVTASVFGAAAMGFCMLRRKLSRVAGGKS
jgi:hypothetical protein